MKDYGDEQVLVVPAELIADFEVDTRFHPCPFDMHLEDIMESAAFITRNNAEQDPMFKQIIPYCIISYKDLILHYSRAKSGAEARLSGQRSIGVGGHINPPEEDPNGDLYGYSLRRELLEEIGVNDKQIDSITTIGWVNDDENEVGKVHFGVVHVVVLNSDDVSNIEEHLTDVRWATPAEIVIEHHKDINATTPLETWSQMILDRMMLSISDKPDLFSDWQWTKVK